MFTLSPGRRPPQFVTSSVVGIKLMVKTAPETSFTVSETPSSATEPFGATYFARASGALTSKTLENPDGAARTMLATPSTWPETRWPPSSSPARSERSRLISRPGLQLPSVVLLSVSSDTSSLKRAPPGAGSTAVAVRQQPSQQIDAPSTMEAGSHGHAIVKRPFTAASTTPFACTRPVNIGVYPSPGARWAPPSPARGEGLLSRAPRLIFEVVSRSTVPSPLAGEGQGEG